MSKVHFRAEDLISILEIRELSLRSKILRARKKSDKIMIVLHGRGDSIHPFFHIDEEFRLNDMNFLLLNARRRYGDGYSWYTEPPSLKSSLEQVRNLVLNILCDLVKIGFKTENIYLLGFSQGGLLSSDIALHFEKRLGGVVIVSGYFYFMPRWRQRLTLRNLKTPWLIIHGRQDDVLPISETKYGAKKLMAAGLPITWKELDKDHSMGERDAYLIKNGTRKHALGSK